MEEGTTFINYNILAAESGDQNQEQAFQIHIGKCLQKHSSVSFEMWRLHLFILSRKNMLKFPNRYSVSTTEGEVGGCILIGPTLCRLIWSKIPVVQAVGGRGALSHRGPQRLRDRLSQMQTGEQRAGFICLHPTGPWPRRGGSIPMPVTWPLWHKGLLIILILNIKLK